MATVEYAKGLEGVIAAETHICKIDGEKGKLYYYGYSIEDLVEHCSFEEITYLLLYKELPTKEKYEEFSQRMRQSRALKKPIIDMIRNFPEKAHPMELLQSVISYLSGYIEHQIQHSATCNCRRTLHQVVQLASVVAAYHRFRQGKDFVEPDLGLSHGANFLYMMRGEVPDPDEGEIMDKCLVLHAEHGFNASTFSARVSTSTLSDIYSALTTAIGTLKGPLHGGANQRVMEMLKSIESIDKVEEYIDGMLNDKKRIMGFGHRVYKVEDPRAKHLRVWAEKLSKKAGHEHLFEIANKIEELVMKKKGIYPNVDFYSAVVQNALDIPTDYYTCIFAAARAAGWIAHIREQLTDNRLIRPTSRYEGPLDKKYVPIEERE